MLPAPLSENVESVRTLAPWRGGKLRLARQIVARIGTIPHRCYAEPFAGMGGVFFRRRQRPQTEILNDIDGEIVNLFRVVQRHPDELGRCFSSTLTARAEFERMLEVSPDTLTDIDRAARFLYLQRTGFAGKPRSPGDFAPAPTGFRGADRSLILARIAAAHRRLERVYIDRMDWEPFIRRYDRPFTLFYLDPPYWGHETDYGVDVFRREDFARMAELLAGIEGRFILSLNDAAGVRETFAAFAIEELRVVWSTNGRAPKRVQELLISN